ncbi:uncharacterized protein LOC122950816 [Acropora millepora]|uniref:uncharacterized protein LOC122950816 n=1 Tax=Acropora millepora TaxID=45264 RepID=UPI001CF46E06|nr:uncharacterized protein LOC122950816 [Acropora millepora]
MIIQLEKDVVFHLISKIFSLSQIRSKMGTSSSHDLSIDSVEVFEDIFASTLSSQFSHSTPIKGTIHGKPEIVAVVNTFEVFDKSASSDTLISSSNVSVEVFAETMSSDHEDLLKAMESCLTTIWALPFLLDIVFNIKEWLSPHANELHSHTQPKCFKI